MGIMRYLSPTLQLRLPAETATPICKSRPLAGTIYRLVLPILSPSLKKAQLNPKVLPSRPLSLWVLLVSLSNQLQRDKSAPVVGNLAVEEGEEVVVEGNLEEGKKKKKTAATTTTKTFTS